MAYHHLSYVLFRTDANDTMILGARCPDPKRFPVGYQLTDVLQLDEGTQNYLFSPSTRRPIFAQTNLGVGILDMRYHLQAGFGIYWHIHADPDSVARLVNYDVLGDPDRENYVISRGVAEVGKRVRASDVPCYEILQDVWRVVGPGEGAWITRNTSDCIYGEDLARLLERMAIFVGCRLTRGEHTMGGVRILCRRPALLEACLLCLLTEVATHSADGEARYEVGSLENVDGAGLAMELRYSIAHTPTRDARLDIIHRHLLRVADLGGLLVFSSEIPLKYGEKKQGKLPQMRINLDWLYDPTVLASSDMKADPKLRRDPEE